MLTQSPPAEVPSMAASVGSARLSRRGSLVLGCATVCCLAVVAYHLLMVFLWNSPRNVVTDRLNRPVQAWMNPLFVQDWRLFAPDPWSNDVRVSAQALRIDDNGRAQKSRWVDLTTRDLAGIHGTAVPSRLYYETLRAANFYLDNHEVPSGKRTSGDYSTLSETSLYTMAARRLGERLDGARTVAVRVHLVATPIPAPAWLGPAEPRTPTDVTLAWRITTSDDS
jgi:hypothetical protein